MKLSDFIPYRQFYSAPKLSVAPSGAGREKKIVVAVVIDRAICRPLPETDFLGCRGVNDWWLAVCENLGSGEGRDQGCYIDVYISSGTTLN